MSSIPLFIKSVLCCKMDRISRVIPSRATPNVYWKKNNHRTLITMLQSILLTVNWNTQPSFYFIVIYFTLSAHQLCDRKVWVFHLAYDLAVHFHFAFHQLLKNECNEASFTKEMRCCNMPVTDNYVSEPIFLTILIYSYRWCDMSKS